MRSETLDFTPDGRVNLRTCIHAGRTGEKRAAIIVLPGGVYGFLSEEEGEPVALTFFAKGFDTFVLGCSVGNNAPGKSLAGSPYPGVDMWVPLCVNWINGLFRLVPGNVPGKGGQHD